MERHRTAGRRALLLFVLATVPQAHAQPSYRGTYAADCSKQQEASLTIGDGAIVLRTSTGARSFKPVEENVAFYGRLAPPAGFITFLSVDAQPGKALSLEVFEDGDSTAVEVSGHPDVERTLPASMRTGRLRRCAGKQ